MSLSIEAHPFLVPAYATFKRSFDRRYMSTPKCNCQRAENSVVSPMADGIQNLNRPEDAESEYDMM